MDLDIGGAGRVMQGDPDPSPLENSNFLNSHCKTIENRPHSKTIENRPRAVTPHTPQWQKNKFALIRS